MKDYRYMILSTVKKKLRSSSVKKVADNTAWLISEKVVSLFTSFVVGILLARYLGRENLGILQYSNSIMAFAGLFVLLGLQGIVVRDLVDDPEHSDLILGTTLWLKIAGSLLCFSAVLITSLFSFSVHSIDFKIQLIVACAIFFKPMETANFWFESQIMSKYTALRRIITQIVFSLIRLVAIGLNASLAVFAYLISAEAFFAAWVTVSFYVRRVQPITRWRFTISKATELLSQSWLMILSNIMTIVNLRVDQIMLRWMKGTASVGEYSVAVTLSEGWYFVGTALVTSAFPILQKTRNVDMTRYRNQVQQLYDILFWIPFAVAVLVTFLARPTVLFLYGPQFARVPAILTIHIWAGLFAFSRLLFTRCLISDGNLKYIFFSNMLGAITNVVLNLFLIPPYSGSGAAIATMISYAVPTYFALFFTSSTRPMAFMMTKSFVLPVRLVNHLLAKRKAEPTNKTYL